MGYSSALRPRRTAGTYLKKVLEHEARHLLMLPGLDLVIFARHRPVAVAVAVAVAALALESFHEDVVEGVGERSVAKIVAEPCHLDAQDVPPVHLALKRTVVLDQLVHELLSQVGDADSVLKPAALRPTIRKGD